MDHLKTKKSAQYQELKNRIFTQIQKNYIDSSEYASWEQYFTQYLADMTKDHPLWCYSKKKLPAIYLSARVLRAAKKFMQLIIWD